MIIKDNEKVSYDATAHYDDVVVKANVKCTIDNTLCSVENGSVEQRGDVIGGFYLSELDYLSISSYHSEDAESVNESVVTFIEELKKEGDILI